MSTRVGSAACEAFTRLAHSLPVEPETLSDGQLIALLGQAEAAERQAGAVKLAVAGEVARRSQVDDPDSLARRLGFKTAAAALAGVTGSSGKEAARLVKDVEELKKLPAVEAAVLDGRIGREAAQAITGELRKAAPGADASELAAVESELVELATSAGADEVKARAAEKAATMNIAAVEDTAAKAMDSRFFWVGPTVDGCARVSGSLPAGHAAVVRGLFDGLRNPAGRKVSFRPAGEPAPDDAADNRTAGQQNADHLRDLAAYLARTAEAPDLGGDHPTVWLSTTARELEEGSGLAFYAGTPEPVPVADAVQAACAGGLQTVVFDDDGAVLRLGRSVRAFTKRQRRAIALRDGGTCLIPGCTVPAQWCEVHHVVSYKDGGPTDVGNGVNLCWFHHHEIDVGPWHIRMRGGTPEVSYTTAGNTTAGNTTDWNPTGDGASARIAAASRAGSGAPPGAEPGE